MGAISGRQIGYNQLHAYQLKNNLRKGKYFYLSGFEQPALTSVNGDAVPAGTTGATNRAKFVQPFAPGVTYFILGALQTILGPRIGADGLDIALDKTDNEGAEYVFGDLNNTSPFTFTVGTDEPFFVSAKFKVADVSGTDDFAVGFRKQEAFQANIDDYDEMACLNTILGDIKVETILNGAATVTTDTTLNWADAETHTVEVRVVGRKVYYFVDGKRPDVTGAQFSFDAAEKVVPFIYYLHATTTPGVVSLVEAEGGLLSLKGVVANG